MHRALVKEYHLHEGIVHRKMVHSFHNSAKSSAQQVPLLQSIHLLATAPSLQKLAGYTHLTRLGLIKTLVDMNTNLHLMLFAATYRVSLTSWPLLWWDAAPSGP
jgi:hypothetical protein